MTQTMAATTDALVLHGAKDLKLEKRPIPKPQPGEVQVSIKATGLCGSDLHYYTHGRNGNFVLQHPLVLGHEASGIVTALPNSSNINSGLPQPAAGSLKVGDRVALEVGFPCRICNLCASGRYNLCPALRFKSSAKTHPHLDGTLQALVTQPEAMCHKLPEIVTFEQGALVEPLAVSLHAINRSTKGQAVNLAGSTALVLGAGAVGMLTAAALAVLGVSQIVIADIDEKRLQIAAEMAGGRFRLRTFVIPRKAPSPTIEATLEVASTLADEIKQIADLTSGFDRVFECTGVPSCVQLGIYASIAGGALVLVGMGNPIQTLPLGAAALREVDIVGVFRYANQYPAAINLFASGKLEGVAEALCSHRVSLADGEKAFRLASSASLPREDEGRVAVKVIVTC